MMRQITRSGLWLVILLVLVFTMGCNQSTSTVQAAELAMPQQTKSIEVTKTSTAAFQTKELDEREIDPAYVFKVKYPAVDEQEDPQYKEFNRAILQMVLADIAQFRKDVREFKGIPPPSSGSFMYVDYEVLFNQNGILSIFFTYDFYLQGAAHPFRISKTMTYQANTEQFLKLVDLFQPGVDYLGRIADYCIEDLSRRGLLEFPGGAAPRAENYLLWNITADGLLITFDEYSVGPYAMGRQQVLVPYTELADILAPSGPLERIESGD